MNMGNDSWLTLAEVIHKSNLDDIEARRLVKKFGRFLAPRNFGDIVKYPAPVADLLARLTSLRRQGWTNEDLRNLLIMSRQEKEVDCQARRSNLLAELQQESATFRKNLEIVMNSGSQMQEELRSIIVNLMTSFDSLIAKMLDQEKELGKFRAKESLRKFSCESADQ
jgi:DNA-binding transcriptional MerR regulator